MTRTVGLIGYPVGHSISPAFQQPAFDQLQPDVRYELWETTADDLKKRVEGIRSPTILGANVTVPYKEAVIPFLDGLDDLASGIGAVNTIVKRDNTLIGYNTDAGGFIRALRERGNFEPSGKKVTMIGAGGAARAISFSLVSSGIKSLTMFDIDIERTQKLASELSINEKTVLLSNQGATYDEAVFTADLLINCTPIGMKDSRNEGQSPIAEKIISPKSLVFDVVYNPIKTPLLLAAERVGAQALGGLAMLVYQGVAAFELWTGQEAPIELMTQKAEAAL